MTEKIHFNSYNELCEHIITNRALSGESRVRQKKLEDQVEHLLDINYKFLLHLTNWSKGHRPPPRNVLCTLIKKASSELFKWNKNSILNLLRKYENLAKIDIK